MHIAEEQHGEFRVYAAAFEAAGGVGFHAGVVVKRFPPPSREDAEAFRDEQLDDARAWASADDALAFALEVGQAAMRAQQVVATWVRSAGT